VVVFGEADLRRALKAYASYYNRIRTHLSLGEDAPLYRRRQTAQIEFAEWTQGDHLRHSKFVALRDDRGPKGVRRELASI
jgi:ATP-dependent DNA ligase